MLPKVSVESIPVREAEQIAEMTDILRRKMERDYARGATKRDAHPKTLGVLRATFTVEPDLPTDLRIGVFAQARSFDCWIRASSASGKPQPDSVPDLRGLAVKLMERVDDADPVSAGQDFIFMSTPTMPLGTVALFRDAVYFSIERSPLLLLAKFLLTGKLGVLKALRAGQQTQPSLLDIAYWSTTPYRLGPSLVVKYHLKPRSSFATTRPSPLTNNYLSETMQAHLTAHPAQFDFCVQRRLEGMPIEDAGIRWDEAASPFTKVATLRIEPQTFRTPEREALGERLAFSPGNAWPEHAPLGGINRARVAIYQALAEFRHQRDGRKTVR